MFEFVIGMIFLRLGCSGEIAIMCTHTHATTHAHPLRGTFVRTYRQNQQQQSVHTHTDTSASKHTHMSTPASHTLACSQLRCQAMLRCLWFNLDRKRARNWSLAYSPHPVTRVQGTQWVDQDIVEQFSSNLAQFAIYIVSTLVRLMSL